MPAKKKKVPDIEIRVRNMANVVRKLEKSGKRKKYMCGGGCSGGFWVFGSALAMILSYSRNEAILWAILHGVLSWFYVLFRAMQIWGWF